MAYFLSLDMGVQSIGWAVVPKNAADFEKLAMGVHLFEGGTDGDIEKGKDESRNLVRRSARALRRMYRRRSQRMIRLSNELKRLGLLPQCRMHIPEDRNAMLEELDQRFAYFWQGGELRCAHLLPYILRKEGLDQKLPEHAVGRALYHLAIRRGFLSNRKAVGDEKEDGVVKKGISELEKEIETSGSRTLGEYFSMLDPEKIRIRTHWTSRKMHEDEFELFWEAQAQYHPAMTPTAKKRVHRAMFFQRALRSQRFLLGKCRLEPTRRRAPMACLEIQRFRYWQKIMDLKYTVGKDFTEIPLSHDQQDILADALENREKLTFTEIRKLLGMKKTVKFNLENGGEKQIRGNTTSCRLASVLPDRWPKMTEKEKSILLNEILQYQSSSGLEKRLRKLCRFTLEEAKAVAYLQLEPGYSDLSRKAAGKLLEKMKEERIHFKEAEKAIYGSPLKKEDECEFLPPLCADRGAVLTNPVVTRALTELRKVVNGIIRKYGKPERIVVELARDMKRSKKEREQISDKMRNQEKERNKAKERIIKELGILEPTRNDIQKWLLAEECGWHCPFTGKQITPASLLGKEPQFDIEHILPFSRSLDDSFMNKTLCDVYENRHVKKNKTPFEAYGHNEEKYREILTRVQNSEMPKAKKERFTMESIPEEFKSRMLNDTRYASKLAVSYLGKLYGGVIELPDEDGKTGRRRVFSCTGQATAWLRQEWGLNSILNDGGDEKNRTDHRHHAIDALVIAFCNSTIVQQFAHAAEVAEQFGMTRRFARGKVDQPRANFLEIVRKAVENINISFRPNRKISGALHEETNYSKPQRDPNSKSSTVRHKRILLQNLTEKDLPNIVDGAIRRLIEAKLSEIGKLKNFADEKNLPYREITTKTGETFRIPIRKVRVRASVTTQTIGRGANRRYVKTGSNHHMEVYAVLDENGNEVKWQAKVVTMFEAYQRRKEGKPIVVRDHGEGTRFKFSLFKNDFLLKTEEDGSQTLYRVFKMNQNGRIGWGKHTDARPAQQVTDRTPGNTPAINTLRGKVIKVRVDHLGNIHPMND